MRVSLSLYIYIYVYLSLSLYIYIYIYNKHNTATQQITQRQHTLSSYTARRSTQTRARQIARSPANTINNIN